MRQITKYSKRIKLMFVGAAVVAGTGIMMLAPWSRGFSQVDKGYYNVYVDGVNVGQVADREDADKAMLQARVRLEKESNENIYIDTSMELKNNDASFGEYTEASELENAIYKQLNEAIVPVEQEAYAIGIEDETVLVSTLAEVEDVLNEVKDSYEDGHKYQVVITESADQRFKETTCELVEASIEPEERPMVMSDGSGKGSSKSSEASDKAQLLFGNKITVSKTYSADTLNVKQAKKKAKSLIKVQSVKKETYNEMVDFETEYVYDDTVYEGEEEVIQQGQRGRRRVVAEVTCCNGKEVEREILKSKITKKPISQIIKVGTMERPTFMYPLANISISSGYGARWGTVHRGIDFVCSTGTSVMASAAGTVTESMWRDDFGYTIVITHDNGIQTRYAHMSQLLAQCGQVVAQGEVIGLSGNTGDSTGPHLHFEVIDCGERLDPANYLGN